MYNNYDDYNDYDEDPFYGYDEEEWYEIEDMIEEIKSKITEKLTTEKVWFALDKNNMNEEKALNFLLKGIEKKKQQALEKSKKIQNKQNNSKINNKQPVKEKETKITRKYSKQDSNNEEYILETKLNKEKIEEPKIIRKNSKRKKTKDEVITDKIDYNILYPNLYDDNYLKNISKSNNINIVICGHVDAGKSTLLGQIFYLLEKINDHSLKKLEKEAGTLGKKSFKFAWILDEREDEREKGITIEVNNKTIEFKGKKFTFLDTPGHKDFIPQMIKGACQADYALLLVEASKSGFLNGFNKGGQTIEHANIINSMGVKNIIIIVNKMDVVKWSQEDFDFIKNKMWVFFEQYKFNNFQKFIFVPISAYNGENIVTRKKIDWYKGDCLFEILDNFKNEIHEDSKKPLRAQINSIEEYSLGPKKGVCLTCKMFGGVLKIKDKILISPNNVETTINSIFIDDKPVDNTLCGNICEVVLDKKFNSRDLVKVGSIISSITYRIPLIKKFKAKLFLSELKNPILNGNKLVFFFGSTNKMGKIKKIKYIFDNQTGKIINKKPRMIDSHDNVFAEIEMEEEIPAECFKNYKFFSRFQMRSEYNVIGFGYIEEIIN